MVSLLLLPSVKRRWNFDMGGDFSERNPHVFYVACLVLGSYGHHQHPASLSLAVIGHGLLLSPEVQSLFAHQARERLTLSIGGLHFFSCVPPLCQVRLLWRPMLDSTLVRVSANTHVSLATWISAGFELLRNFIYDSPKL